MQRKYNSHATIIFARTSVCHGKVFKNSLETALHCIECTWILPKTLFMNCIEAKEFPKL